MPEACALQPCAQCRRAGGLFLSDSPGRRAGSRARGARGAEPTASAVRLSQRGRRRPRRRLPGLKSEATYGEPNCLEKSRVSLRLWFAQFSVCEASVSSEAVQKHQSQRKRSKEETESQETEATLLAEGTAEEGTAVSRSQGTQRTP